MKPENIGIALSGGGIRAMLFHLGLFKWLAKQNLFEEVKKISTVSGASLCVGMIYSHNNLEWPTSEIFLSKTFPLIKNSMQADIQSSTILDLLKPPWNRNANNILANVLERKWAVRGNLQQLSGEVMWYINCTTFETGKRFRFCKNEMGDYTLGYVKKPNIPISEIMAASAGFPILIGPYAIKMSDYKWESWDSKNKSWTLPKLKRIHLWDGGVYDNLGLESIFRHKKGKPSDGLEYIIVSNASKPLGELVRQKIRHDKNLQRIVEIAADQVSSLRTQIVMNFIETTKKGMFLKIGNTADYIAVKSKCSDSLRKNLVEQCMPEAKAQRAREYPTELKKPCAKDIDLLIRHGYEVADCTYRCYSEPLLE